LLRRQPARLWTGKQLFGVLLAPSRSKRFNINLETREKNIYGTDLWMDPADGCATPSPPLGARSLMVCADVCFRNSELISGTLGKTALGGGSKGSVFYHLIRVHGVAAAAECMWRLSKLCARYMGAAGGGGGGVGID
jgi:DNA-directed RNA polymerase III subunit RPC1